MPTEKQIAADREDRPLRRWPTLANKFFVIRRADEAKGTRSFIGAELERMPWRSFEIELPIVSERPEIIRSKKQSQFETKNQLQTTVKKPVNPELGSFLISGRIAPPGSPADHSKKQTQFQATNRPQAIVRKPVNHELGLFLISTRIAPFDLHGVPSGEATSWPGPSQDTPQIPARVPRVIRF